MLKNILRLGVSLGLLHGVAPTTQALDPASLPEVGYHLNGIAYWSAPYFADALKAGGSWMTFSTGQWGTSIPSWNQSGFNVNGFPQTMIPGQNYRAIVYGLHTNYGGRPSIWPARNQLAQGRVVLEWQGDADIRLNAGTYLADQSSGAGTGRLVNGRRVYRYSGSNQLSWLEIHDINSSEPISNINVWLPDPANPENASLEGRLFHPTFLERLHDADWGFIRFMDWGHTNANPQQDWSDRRLPTHAFMDGVLNPRAPASGSPGNRATGVAWEYFVALCNESEKDLWITVPHLATDDYVRKLAQLIRFGSDGVEPYTTTVANPVWPGLDPSRRIFLEYSNEIWSNGYSFPQGDWAQEQATALGISKPQFNARRFSEVFSIFQDVFEGPDRLVRVAATFTAVDAYSQAFLQEMASYGPTLNPPVEPDVVAVTTYFGNGIQDWAHEQSIAQAGTDDPWFYTTATFDAGGGNQRPVTVAPSEPYWTSEALERHLNATFDEWEYRLLSGDAREGAGPDAVGIGGGFGEGIRELANTVFGNPKPIIAYEGGPSLYTDGLDGGDSRDDGITIFMEALNRHPRFRDVYSMHLNMAKSKGLWTHTMFTDFGPWGKYGQWGHLEYPTQPPADSPKYQFLLDWMAEQASINHLDQPVGSVPSFVTQHRLPVAVFGLPYSADIEVAGGDGPRRITVLGSSLRDGLTIDELPVNPDLVRIAGTPVEGGLSFVYLRVVDGDGDPAWRTYNVRTVGGPNTILEVNFEGTSPALSLPWTSTYIASPLITYSGLTAGAGISRQSGDNAFVFQTAMPADEVNSTLALAITDNEYVAFSITPTSGRRLTLAGHEMRFTIRRLSWHAPRRYAVLTSVEGFDATAAVFTTARTQDETDLEFRFTFPNDAAYLGIQEPVEIRLYGFQGQYSGHRTSITEIRLDGLLAEEDTRVMDLWGAY